MVRTTSAQREDSERDARTLRQTDVLDVGCETVNECAGWRASVPFELSVAFRRIRSAERLWTNVNLRCAPRPASRLIVHVIDSHVEQAADERLCHWTTS
jgi:hypothetical protein